jgi:hypothetical protein
MPETNGSCRLQCASKGSAKQALNVVQFACTTFQSHSLLLVKKWWNNGSGEVAHIQNWATLTGTIASSQAWLSVTRAATVNDLGAPSQQRKRPTANVDGR